MNFNFPKQNIINPKQIYRKRSNFVQMKRKDMIKRLKKNKTLDGVGVNDGARFKKLLFLSIGERI